MNPWPNLDDPQTRLMFADYVTEQGDPVGGCLQRILACPDEDRYRLEYVATVEDEQPERSEFIKVQLALAYWLDWASKQFMVLPESREGQHIESLRRRERELLEKEHRGGSMNCWAWSPRITPNGLEVCRNISEPDGRASIFYSRGFVSQATCTWADWSAHHAAILAACPIANAKDGVVLLTTWPNTFDAGRRFTESRDEFLSRRWPGVLFELPQAVDPRLATEPRRLTIA